MANDLGRQDRIIRFTTIVDPPFKPVKSARRASRRGMPHRPVAAGQSPDRDRRRPGGGPTSMAKPANGPRLPSTGQLIWHQTPMCFLDTGLMPVVDRIDMPSCDRYRDADTPGRRLRGRYSGGCWDELPPGALRWDWPFTRWSCPACLAWLHRWRWLGYRRGEPSSAATYAAPV